jgi:Mn-dependent DtxR family transcriptional regulator
MFPQMLACLMNNRDYKEEVLYSEFAFKIYRKILLEEANYTKEIADQLDSKPQSVSNYVKGLREKGLIEKKEKMGRKQLYRAPKDALFDIWAELHLVNSNRSLEEEIEYIADRINAEFGGKAENRFRTRFKKFISLFGEKIIRKSSTSDEFDYSLETVYRDSFVENIYPHVESNWSNLPDWFKGFVFAIRFPDDSEYSSKIVKETLEEIENNN